MATVNASAQDLNEQRWLEEHTKPPFLRRVRIRGYKSIAFCDVSLQPLTLLVGRNGSGKSNFLEALAFLRDVMTSTIADAVNKRGGWSAIVCKSVETRSIKIEVDTSFVCRRPFQRIGDPHVTRPAHAPSPDFEGMRFDGHFAFELKKGVNGLPVVAQEVLQIKDATGKINFEYEVDEKKQISRSNKKTDLGKHLSFLKYPVLASMYHPGRLLLSVLGFQPFIDFGENLRWIGCYNFNPNVMRQPQRPLPGLLERDGRNVPFVLNDLSELDANQLDRIKSYLSHVAPEIVSFKTVSLGEYQTVRFQLRGKPQETLFELDAANMSDGTLRALATLTAAFQIALPHGHVSVLGIEEPETSLHPAATKALVDALDEATQHTQIVLTTHSADLLSDPNLDSSQVLVVHNESGTTRIAPIDAGSREIVQKELSTIGDLQRMDQLDLDESDLQRQEVLAGTEEKE